MSAVCANTSVAVHILRPPMSRHMICCVGEQLQELIHVIKHDLRCDSPPPLGAQQRRQQLLNGLVNYVDKQKLLTRSAVLTLSTTLKL